jgi:hypothetical protein
MSRQLFLRCTAVLLIGGLFGPSLRAQIRPGQPPMQRRQPFPQPNQPNQPFQPRQPVQPFPQMNPPDQPFQPVPQPQPFPQRIPTPMQPGPSPQDVRGAAFGFGIVLLIIALISLVSFLVWIFVAIWVHRDAQRRGMDNGALWAVLVFFLGLIGLIIYLVIRPSEIRSSMRTCPECGHKRPRGVRRCPHCRAA